MTLYTLSNKTDEKEMNGKLNEMAGELCKKIDFYMQIVKKNICDSVPKAVTLYLINKLEDYMKKQLLLDFIGLTNDEHVSTSKIINYIFIFM